MRTVLLDLPLPLHRMTHVIVNPLMHGRFLPHKNRTENLIFFLHRGMRNQKKWQKSRMFRYGLHLDFLFVKKQQQGVWEGSYRTRPPTHARIVDLKKR